MRGERERERERETWWEEGREVRLEAPIGQVHRVREGSSWKSSLKGKSSATGLERRRGIIRAEPRG